MNFNRLRYFLEKGNGPLLTFLMVAMLGLGACSMSTDNERFRKEKQATIIGYQVYQIYKDQLESLHIPYDRVDSTLIGKPDRAPASLDTPPLEVRGASDIKKFGQIGKDPWGHPYLYKIMPANSQKTAILILSLGKNQSLDTQHFESLSQKTDDFQGDDYGVYLIL
jgi:hypothetical protein